MTSSHSNVNIADLADRYGDAWNRHDLDAILGMHTADSVFALNTGQAPAIGPGEIRLAFAALFEAWPDITFVTRRRYVGSDHFVHEWTVTASLARPFAAEGQVAQPTSRPIHFDGVDVIAVADGLVARKDTYLDVRAIQSQVELRDPSSTVSTNPQVAA